MARDLVLRTSFRKKKARDSTRKAPPCLNSHGSIGRCPDPPAKGRRAGSQLPQWPGSAFLHLRQHESPRAAVESKAQRLRAYPQRVNFEHARPSHGRDGPAQPDRSLSPSDFPRHRNRSVAGRPQCRLFRKTLNRGIRFLSYLMSNELSRILF